MKDTAAIERLINEAINRRVFPGAAIGWSRHGVSPRVLTFGRQTYEATAPAITPDSVFDVASVTKSIPTSSIIIDLLQKGELRLDDKAIDYLPELANQYRDQITLRHLLTYTVVLADDRPLSSYASAGAEAVKKVIFTTPLAAPPGEKYHYANATAIWLGLIAERKTGRTLPELADELFFQPLGMKRTTFQPEQFLEDVVPTEIDWRGVVRGVVHDEAAWALQHGGWVPGNAGLFSTAGDLTKFMAMVVTGGVANGRTYFDHQYLQMLPTNQIKSLNTTGLGWEIDWPNFWPNPDSRDWVGKTGFTGCLVLGHFPSETAMTILTNRTYPHRPAGPEAMNDVCRRLIPLLMADD